MIKILCSILIIFAPLAVWADDFIPAEEESNSSNTFILDADNTGGDIALQFGETLAEYLRWNNTNNRFELSDNLSLEGSQIIEARFENLPTPPTCDGLSIGKIYHNTTDSLTYVCDGTDFNPLENILGTTVQFPAVQARRTTSYTLTTTFTDIDLDTTDLENDATTLDHDDTLRDRVNINETGLYQVIYSFTSGATATATHEAIGQVRLNDTTVINGSNSVNKNYQGEYSTTSASFIAALTVGDFISLQLQRDATVDETQGDIFFSIIKLEGIKGDKGDPGEPGIDGDHPQNTDTGTSENIFVLDNDNTGGDVVVQFGGSLAESLTWNDVNLRFDLTDTLRVAGNLEQEGNVLTLDVENAGVGADVDIVAEQGSDNNGTLRYNATSNQWEMSNDGGAFAPIGKTAVLEVYDATGNISVTQTEATLNLDTTRVIDSDFSLAADEVTINTAGLYRVTGRLTVDSFNTSGTQRANMILNFQTDTGSGFADVPGTECRDYMREQNNGISSASCSVTWLADFSAGEVLRLTHQMSGTTTGQTLPLGSGLIIEFVR